MEILLKPSFLYDKNRATWAWHKSWILPEIAVRLVLINLDADDMANRNYLLEDVYIKVMVVKPTNRHLEQFSVVNVGVDGTSIRTASLKMVVFDGLKFTSTSFKHGVNQN
jgi:hypothetical protein